MSTFPIVPEEMKLFFRNNYVKDDPDSLEMVLCELKNKGYSQMQSLFLLVEEMGMSFAESNRTILNSKTWNG